MRKDISKELNELYNLMSEGIYIVGYSSQEIYCWAKENIPSDLIIYYIWKIEQLDQILIHDNWQIVISESFWKHDISLWQQLKEWGCIIL